MTKKYILLFLFGFWCWQAAGQTLKSYSGKYSFAGKEGQASFSFLPSEGKSMVLQGDFLFENKTNDSISRRDFIKDQVKGKFEQGLKTGDWSYTREVHELIIKDIRNFEVDSELRSDQLLINGSYKSGSPDGIWKLKRNLYSNDRLFTLAESDQITFTNGMLNGKVFYRTYKDDRTLFIRGSVSKEGFFEGEWTLVYEQDSLLINEVRNYESGFLLGLVKRDFLSGKVIQEQVFYETIDRLKQVNDGLNTGFRVFENPFGIEFNDGFLRSSEPLAAQSAGNQFLESFLKELLQFDTELVAQNGELIKVPVATRRFVFELSRGEQALVESIPGQYNLLSTEIESYLSSNTFRINRIQSDSLSMAYRFLEIQLGKLNRFQEIVGLMESKEIQFSDANQFKSLIENASVQREQVSFERNGQEKSMEVSMNQIDLNQSFYPAFSAYLQSVETAVDQIGTYVDSELEVLRRNEELRLLLQEVGLKSEEVSAKYQPLDSDSEFVALAKKSIFDRFITIQLNQLQSRMSQETSLDQKVYIAESIIDLLDNLDRVHGGIFEFDSVEQSIDELYQEEIFNPFTYTRYDQRSKPRLYDAFELLLENYQNQLLAERDFAALAYWVEKVQNLEAKMESLREEETRRLEKQLNKRNSINKLESLLGLN